MTSEARSSCRKNTIIRDRDIIEVAEAFFFQGRTIVRTKRTTITMSRKMD